MSNSLDPDGRGLTERQLLGCGIAVLLVIALATGGLLAKSTGMLNAYVRVVADLINVGDGLPANSDVKYHGLLVGTVTDVTPAAYGKPNYVHINLKPGYAKDIPSTITARVVPSNVFAVSSIQLVDPGDGGGPAIGDGAHIAEDGELSTVVFQTTVSKLRDILAATGRGREDHSLGILAAVGAATENRRVTLLAAGAQLTRVLDALNGIVATEPGPSTVSALLDATHGLQSSAPDLVDSLHEAIKPMRTFAEKRAQLTSLIAGAQHTLGVNRAAFDNHVDQLIQLTHDLTPVLGVFANNADKFVPIFTRVNRLSDKFFDVLYDPDLITKNMRGGDLVHPAAHLHPRGLPAVRGDQGPELFHRTADRGALGAARDDAAAELPLPGRPRTPGRHRDRPGRQPAGGRSAIAQPSPRPDRQQPAAAVVDRPGTADPQHRRPARPGAAATAGAAYPGPTARTGSGLRPGLLRRQRRPGRQPGRTTTARSDHRPARTGVGGDPTAARPGCAGHRGDAQTGGRDRSPNPGAQMNIRGPAVGLAIFMVISTVLTWLVYATLRRDVAGSTTPYAAVFTNVYGLHDGDDVRMAGVRVGRVEKVELDGKLAGPPKAKVSFIVQNDQRLYGNTVASVTYQNIIGQRYLGLSLGTLGNTEVLPAHSVIGVDRTEPSFDVGVLLNGFEPLMSLLNPKQADDLTRGVLQSLQGDRASMADLVGQTSTLTATLAGRDQVLGDLITSLNKVTGALAGQNDRLDHTLNQARRVVTDFDSRRPALQSSIGSLAQVTRQLSKITDDVYPALDQMITRQPGFTKHMAAIEPQLAFTGDNLPLLLKGLGRVFGEGSYGGAYLCDLNIAGFWPGLNDITTIIVNAATPGNARPITRQNLAWHTPRCRNTVNG